MSQYLSEEQQIERIKKLWDQYGNLLLNLVLVVAVTLVAWQWWQRHQQSINTQASGVYQEFMESFLTLDKSGTEAHGKLLIKEFPSSSYAHFAHLVFAKIAADKNQYAEAISHLSIVRQNGKSKAIRQIARLREARVQLALKHFDKALALLADTDDPNYKGYVNQIKGDVFKEQGKQKLARLAYQSALEKIPPLTPPHTFLEMKINSLSSSDKHVVQTKNQENRV